MSANKTLFKNKTFIIILAFLLALALTAGVFGLEYSSAVSERDEKINSQNSQIEALKTEKNALESKVNENESKIVNQQKEQDKLNSQIKALEDEVSRIKLTKAQKNSSTNSKVNKNPSNLTSPNNGSKICYLTFDDGPSDNTLKILDILKKANAKASFFVMGTSKLNYIKRAYAEGHTIALHTDTHAWTIYKSETAYFNDLNKISNKVKGLIGIETKIIRFPGGSSNTKSKGYNKGIMTRLAKQVQQKGYVYVDWNVDSGDASGNNVAKAKILSNIKSGSKGKGNICVLMHDTAAKKTTVEALPEIISYLRSQGYKFEALKTDSPIFHHGINN